MKNEPTHYVSDQIAEGPRPELPESRYEAALQLWGEWFAGGGRAVPPIPDDTSLMLQWIVGRFRAATRETRGTRPPRWISVEERLPEFDHVVLAYCADARGTSFIEAMTCGEFEGKIEWYEQDGDYWGGEITHWQPLPEPPSDAAARVSQPIAPPPPIMSSSSEELAGIAQSPGCEPVAPGANAEESIWKCDICSETVVYVEMDNHTEHTHGGTCSYTRVKVISEAAAAPAGTQPAQEEK